jgi:hypothetical protein
LWRKLLHAGPEMIPLKNTGFLKLSGLRENIINQYGDNSHKLEHMYETKDDNLGRRLFLIQKEKAVEDAFEKIRRTMGPEWNTFSSGDWDILKNILGEVWTSIDRHRWGTYSFSKLSKSDIDSIITIGKEVYAKPPLTNDMLKLLDNILSKTI